LAVTVSRSPALNFIRPHEPTIDETPMSCQAKSHFSAYQVLTMTSETSAIAGFRGRTVHKVSSAFQEHQRMHQDPLYRTEPVSRFAWV
jgi:hypothetical protein